MNTNINQLIEKYWNTEASLQEEAELRTYFSGSDVAEEHKQYRSLFNHFIDQRLASTDLDVEALFGSLDNIDDLLEKFWNAETTLEEEKILKTYFNGEHVEDKHQVHSPLFEYYKESAQLTSSIDMEALFSKNNDLDGLIEKYWNAETSLEEEKTLAVYFSGSDVAPEHADLVSVFDYYQAQRNVKSNIDVEALLNAQAQNEGHAVSDDVEAPQTGAKVINFRRIATAVAAIFVLAFAAVSVMDTTSSTDTQYRGKYVQLDDEAETQEAYEITKQALALLSKNMKQSSNTVVTSVAKADKASIFK